MCQDIFLFLGAFMFDLDDPIQYHIRNLYELFYKRKEEEEEDRYFLIREYQREYRIKHKPKKQEVN